MMRERLKKLFTSYPPEIRNVINEVVELEQMHISMKKPHVNEEIDDIVSRIVQEVISRGDSISFQEEEQ